MKSLASCLLISSYLAFPHVLFGQLVYTAPANFGGVQGAGLFIRQEGQAVLLPTGFAEHNFPSVSRDSRYIIFSSPDGVTAPLQVPPSSDIYVFDRAVAQTRRIVDHTTQVQLPSVMTYLPVSAALSPNNQVLAYGVMLTIREGAANPQATRELNIARASDGLVLHNPTFGRGPVSDSLQAEFVGISWDPSGESFVTPSYVNTTAASGIATQLPAIVRFARNPANDAWGMAQILSAPVYDDTSLPPRARIQIYPALSPSGAGLAYFQLTWPDVLGASLPVTAQLIIANADGSGARTLSTFNPGFYPAGLAWTGDGANLIFSIAQQAHLGTGYLAMADPGTAVIRSISTSSGTISPIPGIDAGFLPSYGFGGFLIAPEIPDEQLSIGSSSSGGLRLSASGLDPELTYRIQSTATLGSDAFGEPQSFTGAQLLEGIELPLEERFYRMILPEP